MNSNPKKPIVQVKANAFGPSRPAPVAPAVYRPQPAPRVLQTKERPGASSVEAHIWLSSCAQEEGITVTVRSTTDKYIEHHPDREGAQNTVIYDQDGGITYEERD